MKCGKILSIFCAVLAIALNVSIASGKDLFVSPSGNDSVSYSANDINTPWRTAEKAFSSQLSPGDTVYFRAGTYRMANSVTQSDSGDGTAAAPITFKNYQNESVTISGSAIRQIYIERDYQYVDGITFYSSGEFFEVGWNSRAVYFKATNCIFHNDTQGGGANIGSIMFRNNNAMGGFVQNCKFYGPGKGSNMNTAGVFAFRAQGIKVLNCEFYDNNNGIFYKHTCVGRDTGIEFAYNYFDSSLNVGIRTVSQYTNIHDNIFNSAIYHSGIDGGTGDDGSNAGSDYNVITNNTFFNSYIMLVDGSGNGSLGNTIRNNVFTRTIQLHPYSSDPHQTITNYNLYPSGNIVLENRNSYTLSSWRSRHSGDSNSISGAATFVGQGSASNLAGFGLASGSPGKGADSNGRDMGANVSSVGVTGSPSSTPVPPSDSNDSNDKPAPVQNLRIVTINQQSVEGSSSTSGGTSQVTLSNECNDYTSQHPEWIFCDDFEGDNPLVSDGRYFQYNNDEGDFVRQSGVGLNGSHAMQALWQSGEVDAGSLLLGFGRNPSSYMNKGIHSDKKFNDIYYRMYIRNGDAWQGNPFKLSRISVITDSNWSQAMIAHLWTSADSSALAIDPASCVDGNSVSCSGWNDFSNLKWLGKKVGSTQIFSTAMAGEWICIEAHVKLNDPGQNNGIQEFWVNGNLEARSDNLNFVGSYTDYGINYLGIENYWNTGSDKQQYRYIDNLVVSTKRIGL